MQGIIALWSGALVDIPAGWHLCDGVLGTPDLRNLFVIGAGDTYAPDATDAAPTHTHTFTGDGHTHTLVGGLDIAAGTDYNETTGSSNATGTTDTAGVLPPYYALAYIQKL